MTHTTQIPSPDELKNRFLIPWELSERMSPWLGLSDSMTYKIVRGQKKPSRRTQNQLNERLGIPLEIWNKNLDELAEYLYSRWYDSLRKTEESDLDRLWELF